jgi:DNA ligase (NAD+)
VVSRASLHNEQILGELDVRVGDFVTIQKAGEIIPQVMGVDEKKRDPASTPFQMPTHCPACGTGTRRRDGEVAVRCPNPTCPAVVRQSIFHYTRRFAMDIDHLGESIIDQLVERGMVKDVADLYQLNLSEVQGLERMGEKSAMNVLSAIERSKNQPLSRLVTGIGIELIGPIAAAQLAKVAGKLDVLLGWDEAELRAQAETINGFGPKMVEGLVLALTDPELRAVLSRLQQFGVSVAEPCLTRTAGGPLEGKSFCVTGVLSRRREDVHADILGAGGMVHDKVKRGTDYLVIGEKVGQSKRDAAKKYGVLVINEAQLLELLCTSPPNPNS